MSATLLAATAASEETDLPASTLANGHHGVGRTPSLLQTLQELLDPDSHAEVSFDLTEAALDAVGRLGSTAAGADLFYSKQHLAESVAALALGRTSEPIKLLWKPDILHRIVVARSGGGCACQKNAGRF